MPKLYYQTVRKVVTDDKNEILAAGEKKYIFSFHSLYGPNVSIKYLRFSVELQVKLRLPIKSTNLNVSSYNSGTVHYSS